MRFSEKIFIFLVVMLIQAVGCGPEEAEDSAIDNELSENFGEVFITYTQSTTDQANIPSSFQISARFIRITDIERNELRQFWGETLPDGELGQCQIEDPPQQNQDATFDGSLELVNAGELFLEVDEESLRIPNWSFPSVYGVVAGVLYGGEALDLAYEPAKEYRLISRGSQEIGPFEVNLDAPDIFENLTISGSELNVETMRLEPRQPLELRWEPGDSSVAEIIVELSLSQFNTEQRIVCRSHDEGFLEISTDLTRLLWEPGVSDARLTLYRLSRSSFQADGLDEAEALFVVSTVIPIDIP